MSNLHPALPATILALGLAVGAASSGLAMVDEHLLANGWEEMRFDGKTANRFELSADQVLTVESDKSVSVLSKKMDIDIAASPILTWAWCVTETAPATDLSVKGSDDRSLALFVAFPYVPEEATFFEKIERKIVEREAGKDAPGRVLMYVWGGEGERGDVLTSPYLGNGGRMIILRPAKTQTGKWFDERIDVVEDYRRIFGSEPPSVLSIAVSADTDDTESRSHGLITNLNFVMREPAS